MPEINQKTITISHEIGRPDGSCGMKFTGLPYRPWQIFVKVDPPGYEKHIKHIKYILPQSYPHRVVKIKNDVELFVYRTCGYQSIIIDCLFDIKSKGKVQVSHFVDFDNQNEDSKVTEFYQTLPPPPT